MVPNMRDIIFAVLFFFVVLTIVNSGCNATLKMKVSISGLDFEFRGCSLVYK